MHISRIIFWSSTYPCCILHSIALTPVAHTKGRKRGSGPGSLPRGRAAKATEEGRLGGLRHLLWRTLRAAALLGLQICPPIPRPCFALRLHSIPLPASATAPNHALTNKTRSHCIFRPTPSQLAATVLLTTFDTVPNLGKYHYRCLPQSCSPMKPAAKNTPLWHTPSQPWHAQERLLKLAHL